MRTAWHCVNPATCVPPRGGGEKRKPTSVLRYLHRLPVLSYTEQDPWTGRINDALRHLVHNPCRERRHISWEIKEELSVWVVVNRRTIFPREETHWGSRRNCERRLQVFLARGLDNILNSLWTSSPRHPRITSSTPFFWARRINSETCPRMDARYQWRKIQREASYIPYLYRNCEMYRPTLKLNLFSLPRYRCISLTKT